MIDLPATIDDYIDSLGKRTRRNLRNFRRKIERDHPEVRFRTLPGEATDPATILGIIDLHRARMTGKGQQSGIDVEYARRLVLLLRACGLVTTVTVNERIIAGALLTSVNDDYFLHVIGHHREFDEYSLGMICISESIAELIDRGASRFHLLWGSLDYKGWLGAADIPLYSLVLYHHRRSLVHAKLRGLVQRAAARVGRRVN